MIENEKQLIEAIKKLIDAQDRYVETGNPALMILAQTEAEILIRNITKSYQKANP